MVPSGQAVAVDGDASEPGREKPGEAVSWAGPDPPEP
jgi:hypothetical protein